MYDVLITGGTVVDGSGGDWFRADVGIVGQKIEAVGDLAQAGTERVINAAGLVVSPGFIDTHVHCDGQLLIDPQHASSLRQGVTTEILGQDGLSYAPLSAENYRLQVRYLSGILGSPPDDLDMSSVTAFRSHYHEKVAVNTAYPVSHGALRMESLGFRDAPLTGAALEHAKDLLREGLEQGAVGLATGMSYHPNAWSTTDELVELCKVVAEAGGVYVTHLRDVNPDRGFGGGGIPEALEIGRRSGVKVHFSHTRTAVANAGRIAELLEPIEEGKSEGIDITLELYPYPTGSSFLLSNLPSWAHDGGPEEVVQRLKDPADRARIIEHLEASARRPLIESVLSYMPKSSHLEGSTVEALSESRGTSLGETVCDILLEQELEVTFWQAPPGDIAAWRQVSRDSVEFLSRQDYMVGSDSIPIGSVPHPRAYGTFPRFLGRLRRQFDVMSLEQMVQRVTDNPARRFSLSERGRIEAGYFADVAVFDPDRLIDNATYDDSRQYPAGVPYVIVNGQVAVDHERCTGVFAGQAVP